MLKKELRLTKNKEFEAVLKKGKSVYSSVLLIKFIKNNLNYSRFGLIVSNKVSKKASQRNLIKRRIREIIRLSINKIKKGFDLVIIVSPKIINEKGKPLDYTETEKILIKALIKGKVL